MSNIFKVFPVRLKELIDEKEISISKMAEEIDVTRQSLSNYLKGESIPNIEILEILADYFQVTTDYLIGRSNERNEKYEYIYRNTGLRQETIEVLECLKGKAMDGDELRARKIDLINILIQNEELSDLKVLEDILNYILISEEGKRKYIISEDELDNVNSVRKDNLLKVERKDLENILLNNILFNIKDLKNLYKRRYKSDEEDRIYILMNNRIKID